MGIWTKVARKALDKAVEGQSKEVERKQRSHDRALSRADAATQTAREVGNASDDAVKELAILQSAQTVLPKVT